MTMPNFLIIGAQKSGTTSLYHYLKQHPQVYMSPIKEPKFLALEGEEFYPERQGEGGLARIQGIRDLSAYQQQFAGVTDEIAIGEASPLYIYVPKAVERIKHYIPQTKLIAILRHPVDRAYSNYLHWVQRGIESLDNDFEYVLEQEPIRIDLDWSPLYHYRQRGFYYQQLKRYFDNFERSQIRVYLYDDFRQNHLKVVQDIFRFLEVDEDFIPDSSQTYNVSQIPKYKSLHKFIDRPNFLKSSLKPLLSQELRLQLKHYFRQKNTTKPVLSPEVRYRLLAEYRDDILQLEDLIEQDLSRWLVGELVKV